MNKFLSRFSNVVWTAILAVAYAVAAVVLAAAGVSNEIVTTVAIAGVTFAILSPKQ